MKCRNGKFSTTITMPVRGPRIGEVEDIDTEATIEYEYTPGCPATGPTYSCGGTPEEPPEAEITRITCADGTEIDFDILPDLVQDTLRYGAIFDAEAGEDAARAMAEDAYEARRRGE